MAESHITEENKIDRTINSICCWIIDSIDQERERGNIVEITEMTKALAKLVSARADEIMINPHSY